MNNTLVTEDPYGNDTSLAVDIPDLKKKDKERQKSGAFWGFANPAGNVLRGAAGRNGVVMGSRAANGVAQALGAAAGDVTALAAAAQPVGASLLARLTATLVGKIVIATVAASTVTMAAIVGRAVLLGRDRMPGAASVVQGQGLVLGAIRSTIKVRDEGDSRALQVVAEANRGLINEGTSADKTAAAKTAAEGPQSVMSPEEAPASQEDALTGKDSVDRDSRDKDAGPQTMGDRLAHDLSGAKLSTTLGSAFGAKDVFAANGTAPKFGAAFDRGSIVKFASGSNGKASASRVLKRTTHASSGMSLRGRRSSIALGQLRAMAPLNSRILQGGSTANEDNSEAGKLQFEGTDIKNGDAGRPTGSQTPAAGPSASMGASNPASGSAPDIMDTAAPECPRGYYNPSISDCVDIEVKGKNETPWQGLVNTAKMLLAVAETMLIIASILNILGYGLIAGTFTAAQGAMLQAIARAIAILVSGVLALVVMGLGMMIKQQGGGPQGDIMMITGGVMAAAAVMAIAAGSGFAIAAMLVGALSAIGGLVGGALNPSPSPSPETTTPPGIQGPAHPGHAQGE